MPGENLLLQLQDDLRIERPGWLSGMHHARTAEHRPAGKDAQRAPLRALFRGTDGADAAAGFQRWRLFYVAAAERLGDAKGNHGGVAHDRLVRP